MKSRTLLTLALTAALTVGYSVQNAQADAASAYGIFTATSYEASSHDVLRTADLTTNGTPKIQLVNNKKKEEEKRNQKNNKKDNKRDNKKDHKKDNNRDNKRDHKKDNKRDNNRDHKKDNKRDNKHNNKKDQQQPQQQPKK